ncbi:MRPL37 [Candida jiufengensis]|uniref:MRPL37 n=1 Tax=Candida jiufengensis TaxID=497108 RepID=UPI0022259072|nr:MRPL37 [Candida jiufengensis]KAI5953569.1 MRPL37 [Candida jiufengensis]
MLNSRFILRRSFTTTSILKQSSCKAGTPLNLKIFKKGDEPVALEDSEYPEWLWGMIDPKNNLENIKNENFLRWRRIKLQKENNKIIRNNNFLSKM